MQLLSRLIQSSVEPFCRNKLVIDVMIMTYTMTISEKYTISALGTLVPSKCHLYSDDRVSLSVLACLVYGKFSIALVSISFILLGDLVNCFSYYFRSLLTYVEFQFDQGGKDRVIDLSHGL